MAYEDCIETINKAAGRKLSDEEVSDMLSALQARERYLKAKGIVTDSRAAALQAANEVANNIMLAAVIEKRNAALNLVKRVEKVGYIQKNFGNNLAEGLEAIMVGVNRAKQGAKDGAAQMQAALKNAYFAGFGHDLEATGHLKLFTSGALDRDVARAMWAIGKNNEAELLARMPEPAVAIAKVIEKWQEISRLDANEAGAWVGRKVGYIARQSHNPEKILNAGYETWRAAAMRLFDTERMGMENAGDLEGALKRIWTDLASGSHLKNTPDAIADAFKGPANLAKKVSQSREIHFKDSDSWFDYNDQFGNRNLREAVASGLSHSADSIGLMRALGTNPKSMIDTIRDDLILWAKSNGDPEAVAKLDKKSGRLENFMAVIDGSMNVPGNAMGARWGANVRGWEMLSKLGSMIFSQLNDIAVYGSGARYQGRGFFSGMTEAVAGLGRNLGKEETRELAASLGVALDNIAGELGRAGSFAEGGAMARMTQHFMKLNLGEWWVNHMRSSAAFGMAHHMASQAAKTWDGLGADYQRALSLYNITPEKWEVIRQTAAKEVGGRDFILPENVRTVGDEKIAAYLAATDGAQRAAPAKPVTLDHVALQKEAVKYRNEFSNSGSQESVDYGGNQNHHIEEYLSAHPELGSRDAHGMNAGNDFARLNDLLTKGINREQEFHSINVASRGSAQMADRVNDMSSFVVLGPENGTLKKDGISSVLVNGGFSFAIPKLKQAFPAIEFIDARTGKIHPAEKSVAGFSGNAIVQARREIEQNLRTYLTDQTSLLALDPDAKVRAIILQGTRPGTATGEMMRFLMQFKSFTGAYMQRIVGRELFGRGYEGDSIIGALRAGNGEFQGLAQLIAMSTILGYGSMALKDISRGKTPRDPTESPQMAFKVMLAAMVQGGGAGIYGDFLFGAASRVGSGTVESVAGPTISTAGRLVDLYHKALAGDDVAANALREALNNTPFLNLFYLRIALDYTVFYRMQEAMNPGYLRRMEREAEKTNAQQFLIRPSEVAR